MAYQQGEGDRPLGELVPQRLADPPPRAGRTGRPMTKETKELAIALRAILAELQPLRSHEHKEFDEGLLALGVYLERKIQQVREMIGVKTRVCPEGNAFGLEARITARRRGGKHGA